MTKLSIDTISNQIVGYDRKVPLLDGSYKPYINFDNAASTPTLKSVLDTISEFMDWYSNIHRGTGFKSQLSTHFFEKSRQIVADFFKADLEDHVIIFGKNGTEAINKLAHRIPLPEDSIILVSKMEHHSNDLPWRFRKPVKHINIDKEGKLDLEDLVERLERNAGKVALVAVTGASNVTGYLNDVHQIAEIVHNYGAKIMVDAAQLAPHRSIDIKPSGHPQHLDFLAFSAHKIYAPFGLGVLIAEKSTFEEGDPDIVGGGTVSLVSEEYAMWSEAPEKEEAGTPNIVGAIALGKALSMINEIGMQSIVDHETRLTAYALEKMKSIQGISFYGSIDVDKVHERLGVISVNMQDKPHALVGAILNYEGGIGVRNGCFCAHPYIKCLLDIGIEETKILEAQIMQQIRSNIPGAVRISFGMYNNESEIDRLVDLLNIISKNEYKGKYILNEKSGEYHPKDYQVNFNDYFSF